MKTINLNKHLLGLDGKELPDATANAGKLLAQHLASNTKGDALKLWSLATRLYSGEEISVDEADLALLKTQTQESEGLTILARSQILTLLSEAK
jgi:hypothetical protein